MPTRRFGALWLSFLLAALSLVLYAGHSQVAGATTHPPSSDRPGPEAKLAAFSRIHEAQNGSIEIPLVNPGFELGCDADNSIGCDKTTPSDIYDAYGNYSHSKAIGEIFTPQGWTVFFKQGVPVPWDPSNPVGFAQPEAHVIEKKIPFLDPPRIHSGQWSVKLFTFFKIHDAGLYQQVPVRKGTHWRLSAWVHAWTSTDDNPYESNGDLYQVMQMVGLDPTGGTNPFAASVVWSEPAHIYDEYAQTHAVEATAQSNTLTVFLRSWVKWPFKHNDVYWDTTTLELVTEPVFLPIVHTQGISETPPLPNGEPEENPFGVVFVNPAEPGSSTDEGRYEKAAALGIGWDRWPLYWYHVETGTSQYNWTAYDAVVEADLSNGLQINPILMGTPGFYATAGVNSPAPALGPHLSLPDQMNFPTASSMSAPSGLYEPVFADGSDNPGSQKAINPNNPWANFVYQVVERYRPGGLLAGQKGWPDEWGISVWEIWNEPDLPLFWNSSVADYARLLKVAALAARQADPDAVIMTGGLADPPAPGYLTDLLAQLVRDPDPILRDSQGWYFDAVALHNYAWSWHTGEKVRQARQMLTNYRNLFPAFGEKPVWVNESGVAVWDDYPGPTWQSNGEANFMATMEEQAAYTIQNAVFALYRGAETVFHFQLYDGCGNDPPGTDFPPDALYLCEQGQICASASAFGLWRNKDTDSCYRQHPQPDTARPAFSAYRTVVQALRGAQPLWHQQPDGDQEWFAFYRPDTKQRIIVLWARKHSSATAEVPAVAAQATLLDQTGTATTIHPSDGLYTLTLPAATNLNEPLLQDSASIGGRPFILIEDWSPDTD